MKQRIRLSILMLWSFMHFLLFAFNGFVFNKEYTSENLFWPHNTESHLYAGQYLPIENTYWQVWKIGYYDITEFLFYGITPILFLYLYNFIKHNQFSLIINNSNEKIFLDNPNEINIKESLDESIKIIPQPKQVNGNRAIIFLLIIIFLILIYSVNKKDNQVGVVIRESNWYQKVNERGSR
jgi:hypothetical protein